MGRVLQDWLTTYLEYTRNSEPPKSYHLWTGISVVAAALQRKVYIPWNMGQLYPNLFVVLVGPSGRCRKGTAMRFGQDLVRQVPTIKLVAQRITLEQMIRDIKESVTEFMDPTTNLIVLHCSMTVMSSELTVFLGSGNTDFLATLTDMFDSEDEWEYRSKHQGKDKIRGLCLNFLGGTAPDWITTMIPKAALGGGFTSRIIFIVERDKRITLPDPTPTKRMLELRPKLIADLEKISILAGQFHIEDIAQEFYEHWYETQDKSPPIVSERFAGYNSRRGTHARKLAMVLSASRSDELVIRLEDLERAIRILEAAEETMESAFVGLGRATLEEMLEAVVEFFLHSNKKRFSNAEILERFYPQIDQYSLDQIMTTMQGLGWAKIDNLAMTGSKADMIYKFTGGRK